MAQDPDEIKQIISIEVKDSGVNEATKDVKSLSSAIDDSAESQKKANTETQKAEQANKSLKSQLKEANLELQKAVQIHGETSKEAIKAAKAVAELNDQMGFARDLAEQFNPDQKFKALGAATQLAATGVSSVVSGMALFGDQSKDTEQALLKVQAAMAFADSIKGLSDLGDQWALLKTSISSATIFQKANTAATVIASGVMKLFGASAVSSSTGFKVLKGAIIGTGIGALVVGVGLLINNFDKVKQVVLNLVPGLAQVGEFIGGIIDKVTDFVGVTSDASRAVDKMKANAESSLALNKKFIAEHGSQINKFTKQKIDAVNEYNELLKEDGANQIALKQELDRKILAIDKDHQDELAKGRKDAADKAQAEREKAAAKAKAKADAAHAKALADRKKDLEEINAASDEIEDSLQKSKQKRDEDKKAKEEKDRSDALQRFKDEADGQKVIIDKKIADDKTEADAKKENQQLVVAGAENLIANISKLAGKNKTIQKAAIIADGAISVGKAGMNTAEAITKDLAKGAPFSIPLMALDAAVGATSIASIISNTNKALAGVGGGSFSGGGASVPNLPTHNVPQVGFQASSENQIATSIAKQTGEQPPIKAIVVSTEITTQQQYDKIKELNNKI